MAAPPRARPQPRNSLTLDGLAEAPGGSPSPGYRSSIHIVPGGSRDTWAGFADTTVSPASQKFHSSFRSMGVKAR